MSLGNDDANRFEKGHVKMALPAALQAAKCLGIRPEGFAWDAGSAVPLNPGLIPDGLSGRITCGG